jgi:hypothetical protein
MANEKRLIDANALRKKAVWGKIRKGTVYETDAKVVTTGSIDLAPTVDAVEVVRCKDCKHNSDGRCCGGQDICAEEGYDFYVADDDFCSYGERREGE